MRTVVTALALLLTAAAQVQAQPGVLTKELLIEYTPDWKGERLPDGRPKVPDAILDRMKNVTLEEAWAVVTGAGFSHQYEDQWLSIHPEKILVGRALTSQWLPGRPDILRVIEAKGRQEGRVGGTNAWPVDMLQPRDVERVRSLRTRGEQRLGWRQRRQRSPVARPQIEEILKRR